MSTSLPQPRQPLQQTSSARLFETHGLPVTTVSDNSSAFTSSKLASFCAHNGIKHTLVFPYHPASNGLAECAVQTVKAGLKKQLGGSLEQRIYRFNTGSHHTPQRASLLPNY